MLNYNCFRADILTISTDIVELPHSVNGYKHLITMIDRFSRWAVAVPVKTSVASKVVAVNKREWIYRYGVPEHILSDNGVQYTSKVFKAFTDAYQIKHLFATPYYPKTNGMVERLHQYIKQRLVLASLVETIEMLKGEEWAHLLPPIMFSYNATINRMTGYSPFELMLNRAPTFPIDLALNLHKNQIG